MCAFIVNPPIRSDEDYYRRDDAIVNAILGGQSVLVVGLRRSGKTSFLLRVERAARAAGRPVLLCDVGDAAAARDVQARVTEICDAIAGEQRTLVLLDEVEAWRAWPPEEVDRLAQKMKNTTFVITCAPQVVLELHAEPSLVQKRLEGFVRHVVGPLSDDEARDLLAQRRRGEAGPIDAGVVDALLARGERLPILLQALGKQVADGDDLSTTLAGVGTAMLSGLTPAARDLLTEAANGAVIDDRGSDLKLLTAVGALRRDAGAGKLRVASPLLGELLQKARVGGGGAPRAAEPRWDVHARILHLSDLHFGPTCIDEPEVQTTRLIAALDQDLPTPDFVAVTGDLSWSGRRDELKKAEVFLDALVAWFCRRRNWSDIECRRRFILVPGNHEASWSLSDGIKEDAEHWVQYSLAPFATFANRFYRGCVLWDLDSPCVAVTFNEPSVSFLALSTAHQITRARKKGRFGEQVCKRAVQLLGQDDIAGARFRIGIWHHNLRAFQDDGEHITDVDPVIQELVRSKPRLDAALHGHVHQGELDAYHPRNDLPPLVYSAVGSFGVNARHRPGDETHGVAPNELALIELQTSGLGRRMMTQYYQLHVHPNGGWVWRSAHCKGPRAL